MAMWAYCVISASLGDNWRVSWQLYVLQRKLQQKKEHKVLELSVRQKKAKENSNVFCLCRKSCNMRMDTHQLFLRKK
jgi:hypothetical protein